MQNEEYRQALTDAVCALNDSENELFTAMINIGFKGVYDDISKLHERNEVLDLELSMFEHTGDSNLDTLIDVIKQITAAKHFLINLNSLEIAPEDLPG